MSTQTFYTRQMLLQYSRQLVAARRLARYDQLLGRAQSEDADAARAKRQAMVQRISREIMENLIFSGSENPIVSEVKENLAREAGEEYLFRYPPGELDFQVFRKLDDGGEQQLSDGEKQMVMGHLWDVTLRTVDATML
ncbi:hypothetical protein LJC46_02700 [Desulfovibrio sp. OttesenSCG-928-G15]|nr:hypothetical protein [Desulfovibrio sp. OttesenSCG-928-G15]